MLLSVDSVSVSINPLIDQRSLQRLQNSADASLLTPCNSEVQMGSD